MDAAAALRDARRRAGFTQAELARRAGTSQAAVSAYERGLKQPSVQTLARMLTATGTKLGVRRSPIRPTAARLARSARDLAEVLALAEALPTRHDRALRFPRLPPA